MEKLLEYLKIKVIKQTSTEYITICPFHKNGQEKHPSFGVRKKDGLFNCFSCGAKGNMVHLVSALTGMNELEAIRFLERERINIIAKELQDVNIPHWIERWHTVNGISVMNEAILELYHGYHPYLKTRGIVEEAMSEFEVGYDRWMDRVTFPVRNENSQLVGIIGRSVRDTHPKYFFYDNFPKGGTLFGLDKVLDYDTIIIVEGVVDVIWLWQNGIKNSVAIMGSMMTDKQASIIARRAERAVLWLDNDAAGSLGMKVAIEKLSERVKLFVIDWNLVSGPVKDPQDLNVLQLSNLLDSKVYYLNFMAGAPCTRKVATR